MCLNSRFIETGQGSLWRTENRSLSGQRTCDEESCVHSFLSEIISHPETSKQILSWLNFPSIRLLLWLIFMQNVVFQAFGKHINHWQTNMVMICSSSFRAGLCGPKVRPGPQRLGPAARERGAEGGDRGLPSAQGPLEQRRHHHKRGEEHRHPAGAGDQVAGPPTPTTHSLRSLVEPMWWTRTASRTQTLLFRTWTYIFLLIQKKWIQRWINKLVHREDLSRAFSEWITLLKCDQ